MDNIVRTISATVWRSQTEAPRACVFSLASPDHRPDKTRSGLARETGYGRMATLVKLEAVLLLCISVHTVITATSDVLQLQLVSVVSYLT